MIDQLEIDLMVQKLIDKPKFYCVWYFNISDFHLFGVFSEKEMADAIVLKFKNEKIPSVAIYETQECLIHRLKEKEKEYAK